MKSKISVYTIIFIIFLILYSAWVLPSFNRIQMSYDESKHAAGGLLWHDYIKTIFSDGYTSFKTFMNQYQKMGYNALWFVNINPPIDGLIRVPFYFMFGQTFFAVRIISLICALISGILIYIITFHITKKRVIALVASVVLLMSVLFYRYSGAIESLATVPNVMMVLFWYYFTFIRKPKKSYRLRIFKDAAVNFNWNILIGGLFLTFATLIKYSAVIFIDMFFVLYFFYLLIVCIKQNKKINIKLFSESGALQIAFVAFIQNIVFLIIAWKWIRYNLFEMRFLERFIMYSSEEINHAAIDLNYLGERFPFLAERTLFSNFTYMIHGYLHTTLFFNLFFIYTLYLLIKGKIQDQCTKKHFIIISLFFTAVYLYFSFRMTNHQIRYVIHPFAFIVIGSAYGLYHLVYRIFKKRQLLIYLIVVLLFVCSLFSLNAFSFRKEYDSYGNKNEELLDFLNSRPEQRFVLHTRGSGNTLESPNRWYYNPDFVMFTFMRAEKEHNPFKFKQNAHLFEFRSNTPNSVEAASSNLINQMDEISNTLPTYVVIFRYFNPEIYIIFGNGLMERNFSSTNLTYWTIYYKE